VIEHSLTFCKECGSDLEDVEIKAYERRQIFDIPPVN
jgi:transposase